MKSRVECPDCSFEVSITNGIISLDDMVACERCGLKFPMGQGYRVIE